VISIIAVFISSTLAYLIGYWLGPRVLRRLLKESTHTKLTELVKGYGVGAIILFRLSPILSNEAISFIPALLRMNYKRFIIATLIGSVPVIAILAVTAEGGNFKTALIWLSAISLVAYGVYLFIDINKKKKRNMKSAKAQ